MAHDITIILSKTECVALRASEIGNAAVAVDALLAGDISRELGEQMHGALVSAQNLLVNLCAGNAIGETTLDGCLAELTAFLG